MRLAWFTDTYAPQTNGVVAYINDALRLLSKNHPVSLFAPGEGKFRIERVSKNLKIYWIPSSPFPFYEGYRVASMDYRRISALIKRERPDIVHAHAPINLGVQGVIAAKRMGIPSVITYHTHFPDYVPHLLNGKLPSPLMRLGDFTAKSFIRHLFRMANAVAAPTNELACELRSYGLDNVSCIPNGIDFAKLSCSEKETDAFRKEHGIKKGAQVVLFLGRLSFEKRLDKLLEAFRIAEKEGRVLLIVGGGPYLKDFRDFARAIGIRNAVFAGFVKNPAPAYHCANIFASASDSETFGLTFVEAMHMGLPVVGVSRLGAKEIITNGKDGLLYEPGDAKGIAKGIETLLCDRELRERMGKLAKKTAKRYSIENSIKETLLIYESVRRGR